MGKRDRRVDAYVTRSPDFAKSILTHIRDVFEAFSPSHKREYIEWIVDAKSEETRDRRVDTAIEWMTEGKPRNWKYMKR